MDRPKFNRKEFERRERDILDKHRMPVDVHADIQELLQSQSQPQTQDQTIAGG